MNNGWPKYPIGEICDLVNGGTPKTGVPDYWGGKHRWITPAEMGRRSTPYVSETERTLTDLGLANSSAHPLPPHSVILSSRAPIGHLVINTQLMAFNQGCKGLVPRTSVDHKYLYYYLGSIVELLNALGTGTTFKELSGAKLKEVLVPLPPLAEQQRIVGILDEAFDGIATAKANAEMNLQNARVLFESHLQTIFTQRATGWTTTTIGESITFIDYRGKTPVKTPSGIRLITAKNVKRGYLQETPMEFIAAGNYKSWMTRGIPKKGDVLFTTEAPLANVAQLNTAERVAFAQRIIIMQPNAVKLDSTFLKYLLLSQPVQRRIRTKGTGATVQGIKASLLKTIEIAFPQSLSEQEHIVARLDGLSEESQRLESIYQRKLLLLETLKKSLLHQAFTGQLTAEQSVVVSFPTSLPNISTADLHAGVLAMAYQLHEQNGKLQYFTHVKAEKIAHMVEACVGIDLGRTPVKNAAGPNDFPHLHKVEHRARNAKYFDFKQVPGSAYQLQKLSGFDRLIERTQGALGDRHEEVKRLLEWMLPMNVKQAEIVATVFSAWNNLLLDGKQPSDEEIIFESRENWHPNKLNIGRPKFFSAVQWLRTQGVVPEGKGRRVDKKPK